MRSLVGGAFIVPLVLLSASPGVAWAKTPATVAISINHVQVSLGQKVVLTAHQSGLSAPLDYAFWVEEPSGHWMQVREMAAQNTASFKPPMPGSYLIQAKAMTTDQLTHHDWNAVIGSPTETLYVSTVPNIFPSSSSVAAGSPVTLMTNSAHVINPVYQFWYKTPSGQWFSSGGYEPKTQFTVPASEAGSYQAVVYVKVKGSPEGDDVRSQSTAWSVYGAPQSIRLTANQPLWVADGAETETMTAAIVDANGNLVTSYNGTGSLTDGAPGGAISAWGQSDQSMQPVYAAEPLALMFNRGVATVSLKAGTALSQDVLRAVAPSTGTAVKGQTTVATSVPVATAIALHTQASYLIANESGNPANFSVSVNDQMDEPMLSGTYHLTANIQGDAGQFRDLTQGPDALTYTGGDGSVPLPVYSIAAGLGPMTLSVSGPDLASAGMTIPAILGGQPYQMGLQGTTTTLTVGQTATLTLTELTKQGGVSDPASLDNAGYTVSITNAQGNQAAGFTLNGVDYLGSPMTFSTAVGPNFFYAVSQPLTLTATSALPGTYDITVTDPSGLLKPSQPLTIDINN